MLDLDNNNEVAGELGPLQYLSSLTGYPMDKIINILLLIIIFVFDPLAISLVVAANFAFDQAYPKKKYKENLYEEKVEVKKESKICPEDYTEDDEKRMDIIGQNGNEGEHYSEIDDKIVEEMKDDGVQLTKKDGREIDKKTYFDNIMSKMSFKKGDDTTKTY